VGWWKEEDILEVAGGEELVVDMLEIMKWTDKM
jgi:hypothetical protein